MSAAVLALCASAAAVLYFSGRGQDGAGLIEDDPEAEQGDQGSDSSGSTLGNLLSTLSDPFVTVQPDTPYQPNVAAFLQLIRYGESSNTDRAYSTLYGGGQFADFSAHPAIYFALPDGRRTSAAGAYQITYSTWNDLRHSYSLPDFSPATQDFAAVCLIKRRGALSDVLAGRFDSAIRKCRNEWTSLPGALEGRYSLDKAHQILIAYGGQFDQGTLA